MRNRIGLVLLAMLTLMGVLLVAGPSTAATQAAASPKGRVFFSEAGPQWAVYIGEGPNPVPAFLIEYGSTFCKNNAGVPRPGVRTGLASVGAIQADGTRRIDGSARFVCANQAMTTIPIVGFGFIYNTNTGKLLAPDPAQPITLAPICNGKEVPGVNTIIGTPKADLLNGTRGMDIIDGRGGNDTIKGRKGDDIICAGNGADVVHGNKGVDLILGQGGRDMLYGDEHNDVGVGGRNPAKQNRELIDGGTGADVLFGWLGRDKLLGRGGADHLYGGPKSDWMLGGSGTDTCYDPGGKTFRSCEVKGS
ncbi:calcium-binding protein [Actinomycetota bacterium]